MDDGKVEVAVFNEAFYEARERVWSSEGADVAAEQAGLRALVPEDASESERGWTGQLIASLGESPAPPRQWSEYYHQAGAVHAAAYQVDGTVEEKIAALEEARRRIWEVSGEAPSDEEIHIKAMTRVLKHLERELRDPTFPTGESG
ncbi:hypothetical protein EV644_111146 [Kribbella orskensis]|uniref:Uncharacterized protein n=1 Tax=Kribbella orskensis TaxID=2512216 RepID=A0ABY2BHS3_9ACTN|nr:MULTISPECIES: hypothetical protein [Kribbella]TCN37590.1 hypothetical protein EV642_111119 [Kribbella sp. VKM Ac-2500]TCO18908.1 hypothetical protein EV644_111146 [Kribbella orskensis]